MWEMFTFLVKKVEFFLFYFIVILWAILECKFSEFQVGGIFGSLFHFLPPIIDSLIYLPLPCHTLIWNRRKTSLLFENLK